MGNVMMKAQKLIAKLMVLMMMVFELNKYIFLFIYLHFC
jgi:hypothetical protein